MDVVENGVAEPAAYTPQQKWSLWKEESPYFEYGVKSFNEEWHYKKIFWPEAVNWSIIFWIEAVDHFKTFGCIACVHIPNEKREKLDDKGEKCIFLGVSDQSKAYKPYNPSTKKILISRDVVFDEELTWPWSDNVVRQHIPLNFDGVSDEKRQQPMATKHIRVSKTYGNPHTKYHCCCWFWFWQSFKLMKVMKR